MDDFKTLAEIWTEADRKPVKVIDEGIVEKHRQPCWLVGMRGNHCYITVFSNTPLTCNSDEKRWKLHKEKKIFYLLPPIYMCHW